MDDTVDVVLIGGPMAGETVKIPTRCLGRPVKVRNVPPIDRTSRFDVPVLDVSVTERQYHFMPLVLIGNRYVARDEDITDSAALSCVFDSYIDYMKIAKHDRRRK